MHFYLIGSRGLADLALIEEFRQIAAAHSDSQIARAARIVLGASVLRVFSPGTNAPLRTALESVDVGAVRKMSSAAQFERWFVNELDRVAKVILRTNPDNPRIRPGYKWGHASKVLSLFLCELLNLRYFTEQVAARIEGWLFVPIDRIALGHLKRIGYASFGESIKGIDSEDKFMAIQRAIGKAADQVGVPRIWFDDLWIKRGG